MRRTAGIDEWLHLHRAAPHGAVARIEQLLAEIGAANAENHVYTLTLQQRARQQARQLAQPFDLSESDRSMAGALLGVPVAVKDNIEVLGHATSCGSIALARPAASDSAAIVRALDAAGAIVIGKTHLDEAALGASGRNPHFGRCDNPRDPLALTGGSSSGSAAAVAAGHVPLAIGTDTLGSVRIPAALCGVVGFKPTPGVLSSSGVVPLYPAFDSVGLLTGSLADAAHALRALCAAPQVAASAAPRRDLRLRCLTEAQLIDVENNSASAYLECIEVLDRSAAIQRLDAKAVDRNALARAALWEVARGFAERTATEQSIDTLLPRLGSELAQLLARAMSLSDQRLLAGRRELDAAALQLRAELTDADALLTPTCPVASVRADDALPRTIATFVAPANIAGLPAVCWPQALSGQRQVSLQLIGRAGEDFRLLQLAQQLQEALR